MPRGPEVGAQRRNLETLGVAEFPEADGISGQWLHPQVIVGLDSAVDAVIARPCDQAGDFTNIATLREQDRRATKFHEGSLRLSLGSHQGTGCTAKTLQDGELYGPRSLTEACACAAV